MRGPAHVILQEKKHTSKRRCNLSVVKVGTNMEKALEQQELHNIRRDFIIRDMK